MGRNPIPKLGVWQDGERYRFRYPDDTEVASATGGDMIVYEIENMDGTRKTLASCYGDGLQQVMASMYECGLRRGIALGKEQERKSIRAALGIKD